MLAERSIHPVLLSKDLKKSREFYADKLGLPIQEESDSAITYLSGNSLLVVTASTVGTKDEQTQASWVVPDLKAELAELKAKGIEPEDYDTEDIKTVDGIFDGGSVLTAWIVDPDGNALGIEQPK
jgi:catechol 2,3-dioxygenase-like lactoylglutathione lyase family enzyme